MIVELGIAAVVLLGLKAKVSASAAATGAPVNVPVSTPFPVTPKPPDVRPPLGLRYLARTPENSAPPWATAPGAPVITNPPIITKGIPGPTATIPTPVSAIPGGLPGGGGIGGGGGGVGGGGRGMLK